MESILQYISPDNPTASVVVGILKSVFLIWCFGLIGYGIWLWTEKKRMGKCEDVDTLIKARQAHTTEGEEPEKTEIEIFNDFCQERRLPDQTPIRKHLQNIFFAGWTESHFEVSELLNHTAHKLFKWNNLLRSVLGIFIVIGLLGTLFGLADSLAQLSPALETKSTQQTNEGLTQALSQLLTQMKSAFAPSILGMGFTILGIVFYSLYLQIVCGPVKSELEWLTLTVWVPQLYPTTSQKLIETLQQSEQQMRKGFETAAQVNELVTTVQSEISDFSQSLSRANDVTGPLATSVSQINQAAEVLNESFAKRLGDFSDEFSNNVSRLTSFQSDIRTLYQQMIDESGTFQKSARATLEAQNTRLLETLNALKSYEDAYIIERGQIDAKLQKFLDEATQANTSINAENRQLIGQIRDQLTTQLGEIEKTLGIQLSSLIQRFNSFDVPIKDAAESIAGSQESFAKFMERTVGDLQQVFQKQNDNNRQQLDVLTHLNQRIESLLDQLAQNSKTQGAEVHVLSQNIGSLKEDITSLTSNINTLTSNSSTFSQAVIAIESHVQTLGSATQQFSQMPNNTARLVSTIDSLNQCVGAISQHVQTLAESTQKLAEQARDQSPPETRERKISFFKSLFLKRRQPKKLLNRQNTKESQESNNEDPHLSGENANDE